MKWKFGQVQGCKQSVDRCKLISDTQKARYNAGFGLSSKNGVNRKVTQVVKIRWAVYFD